MMEIGISLPLTTTNSPPPLPTPPHFSMLFGKFGLNVLTKRLRMVARSAVGLAPLLQEIERDDEMVGGEGDDEDDDSD